MSLHKERLRSLTTSSEEHVEVRKMWALVWKGAAKGSPVPFLLPSPFPRALGPILELRAASRPSPLDHQPTENQALQRPQFKARR